MWDNFPAEIVTTPDIENFSMLSSQQWKSFGEYFERIHDGQSTYQRILYEQSSIEQALKFLPMAKNQNFFKEFSIAVYFSYSVKSAKEIEAIVSDALDRYLEVFPSKSEDFFELKYHQILVNDVTQTHDEMSLIYEVISEMEALGFDAQNLKNILLQKLIAGGEFKRALPLAEDALERSLLELKDNEVSSK